MPRKTKDKPQSNLRPTKSEGRLRNIVSGRRSWFSFHSLTFATIISHSHHLLQSGVDWIRLIYTAGRYTLLQFGKKRHEVSPLFDFNKPLQESFRREFAYGISVRAQSRTA